MQLRSLADWVMRPRLLYPFTGWLLAPIIASAAMALSSVSVVTNALRVRGFTVQRS